MTEPVRGLHHLQGLDRYDTRTRKTVVCLPVTCEGRLIGKLWASAADNGISAGFYPKMDEEIFRDNISRLMGTGFWGDRLRESFQQGLLPRDGISRWIGEPEHPLYGGVAANARASAAGSSAELWRELNPGVALDPNPSYAPLVQDGEYPDGSRAHPPESAAPISTYPDEAVGELVFLAASLRGGIVGYVWASSADNAAGWLPLAEAGSDGVVAGALWRSRLMSAYSEGMAPLAALRRMRLLRNPAEDTFGRIEPDATEQRIASFQDLRILSGYNDGEHSIANEVPPLARTNAEARMYADLKECERCGKRGTTYRSSVIRSNGMLIGRYRGTCDHCQNPFQYDFRLPEHPLPTPTDGVLFGGAEPSVIFDPAIWLRLRHLRQSGTDGQQRTG